MHDAEQRLLRTVLVVGHPSAGGPAGSGSLACIAGEVVTVEDAGMAGRQAKARSPDLVIIREELGTTGVLDVLEAVAAAVPEVPSVVVTGAPSKESALTFTRKGAYDYIEVPLEGDRLDSLLAAASRSRAIQEQAGRFFCPYCPPGVPIVGRSKGITGALELLQLISYSNCDPVLILGETGTGKELAARGVHTLRCREEDRFIAVNCAALTANLLESELFGHVKGAFTGADKDKTGLFEAAGRGTIFLDEISEMPPELQAKLLRVLQEKTFRKVGGTTDMTCRANIIVSSNRDLLKEVAEGRFRRDLYYRLAVFPITVPPLRSELRRSDIPLLAEYFIRTSSIPRRNTIKDISLEARRELMQHDWPGNVRELRNVIDRALIVEKTDAIQASSIIIESQPQPGREEGEAARDFSLEAAEREFIVRALQETGWQRTRAAALLGITRATLYAKLKRYGIEAPDREPPAAEPPLSKASGD